MQPTDPVRGSRFSLSEVARTAVTPIDAASLTFFRIIFGCVMAWWAWDYLTSGRVREVYVEPVYHFTYPGFAWVQPWPGGGMYLHFLAIIALAICVAAGVRYQVTSLLLAVAFTYVFLIEKTNYQNHYYLIGLIAWWMPWLPLNRCVAVDAARKAADSTIPQWALWIVRFHIGLPYVYGGLAKFDSDWFAGEPMGQMLAVHSNLPYVGSYLQSAAVVQCFVWGGVLFDLLVVPGLMVRKTRPWAYVVCIVFHVLNSVLFEIHIFPWFMILATTVFFEPDWPRRVLGGSPVENETKREPSRKQRVGLAVAAVYIVFHLVWPFRHWANSEGNTSWTEQGHYFAWRMMLRGKTTGIRYHIQDQKNGQTIIPDLRPYIALEQSTKFPRDPEMIVQFARFLASEYERQNDSKAFVYALVLTSMNGRKPQLLIDPNVDLAHLPADQPIAKIIVPLTEPLRAKAWDVPLMEWERHVKIPERPYLASLRKNTRSMKPSDATSSSPSDSTASSQTANKAKPSSARGPN